MEIHNAGLELVTIHDRPEGSYLRSYRYIVEVVNEEGITENQVKKACAFSEVLYLGSFNVAEKQ